MTELISDPISPGEIIIPTVSGSATAQPQFSGALFISGSKLYFHMGTPQLITSA